MCQVDTGLASIEPLLNQSPSLRWALLLSVLSSGWVGGATRCQHLESTVPSRPQEDVPKSELAFVLCAELMDGFFALLLNVVFN